MANDQNPERVVQAEIRDRFREDLSPTPLDVEAIRARLDAVGDRPWTTQHNSYGDEWWFGGSSGSGENVIAFGDDDLGVLQGDCRAEANLIANAPGDLAYLLEQNALLEGQLATAREELTERQMLIDRLGDERRQLREELAAMEQEANDE